MRAIWAVVVMVSGLAGCAVAPPGSVLAPQTPAVPSMAPGLEPTRAEGAAAARNFIDVVNAIEPVAEAECRARTTGVNCDYLIVVDDRRELPPNAFQTLDANGRPIVGFTVALIAEARNTDELAFILGHEAAHHIAGHIPRARQSAMTGAVLAGVLATVGGADAAGIRQAQNIGASLGARRYSQSFELEADALGTLIAFRAGFDPVRGAEYFARIPDPGNQFLGTHPPNAQRIAIVQQVASGL